MNETDWMSNPTADFAAAGFILVWSPANGRTERLSHAYVPSEEAKNWDGAMDATHAIGSRFGGFSYVKLQRTGRKPTKAPGGAIGVRAQMTFLNIGPSGIEIGEKVTAWVI